MVTTTQHLLINKADPADAVNLVSHLHDGWDTIDNKIDNSALGDLNLRKSEGLSYTPVFTNISNASAQPRYLEIVKGDLVQVQVRDLVGAAATGIISISLPVACVWPIGSYIGDAWAYDASAGTVAVGAVILATSTTVNIASTTSAGLWNASVPFIWAAGDAFGFEGIYEA